MHETDDLRSGSALAAPEIFRTLQGQRFAAIDDIRQFPAFFINVVSASDLWMFLSSRGGLTAGRGSAEGAIFPYETVDRLHHAHHTTGPVCLLRIHQAEADTLWQPFGNAVQSGTEQTIFKKSGGESGPLRVAACRFAVDRDPALDFRRVPRTYSQRDDHQRVQSGRRI